MENIQRFPVRVTAGTGWWAAKLQAAFSSGVRLLSRQRAGAEATLSVESRLSLGPKKMLFLVRCEGQKFLVAADADSISSVVKLSVKAAPKKQKRSAQP